jgi:hypothetical protein
MIRRQVIACVASALVAVAGLAVPTRASEPEPRSATLLDREIRGGQDNYALACFSFEHGGNGEQVRLANRNDWDVIFGNSPVPDAFDVTTVTDDRSRIADLGPGDWARMPVLRDLMAHPEPAREPSVKAVVGHFYLVHTVDRDTDLYALFRVETLEPGKSVTITWIVVPPEWIGDAAEETR